MQIIYKEDNIELFLRNWQEYIDNNLVSYKYTFLNIEYFILYSKYLIKDKSFVIIENNKCVGICFLPIEKIETIVSISISNSYVFAPLTINKRIEKKIYETIELIIQEFDIQKINFALDPLILEYKDRFNYLLEYGFVDTSTSDCLIDLKLEEKKLWTNLRKSYKALINSILKNEEFEIVIIDKKNSSYELHEIYRELHAKCAGGATRVKETFDKQFEMLENDCASLIGLKYNSKFIGFNYFFHFQKTVIYASGADDPAYENSRIPIYHVILWKAIQYYKKREFDFIEFSQPCGYNKINGFEDYLDEKQINISHFKRGMGTKMVPAFRGVKYFDKYLFLKDIKKFKDKVVNINV